MNADPKFQPFTPAELAAQPMPAAPEANLKLGQPSHSWTYRNASREVLHHICRFDPPDGKQVWPLTLWRDANGLRWRCKAVPDGRLYGLDRLAARPDASIVVVEGEKSADTAAAIFPKSA